MKDVTDWAQLNAMTILVFCLPCLCIGLFICFLFALWKTNLINSQARGSMCRRNGSLSSRGIWTSLTYVEKHNESLFLLGDEKGQEDLIIHFEVYMSRVYHFFLVFYQYYSHRYHYFRRYFRELGVSVFVLTLTFSSL